MATVRTAAKFAAGGVSGPAASLAEGVIRAMVQSKLKSMVALAAVLVLLVGGLGLLLQAGQVADPNAPVAPAAPPPAPKTAGIRPYVVWSGPKSGIRETSYRSITSADEWSKLWQAHSTGDVPKVDFEQCMVVAVFQASTISSKGVKFVSATEDKEAVTLRFYNDSYQTDGGADAVTPYGLFVLPRSAKAIVLEEDVQSTKGRPPVWKLRAQFDGKKDVPVGVNKEPIDVTSAGIEKRLKEFAFAKDDKDTPLRYKVREAARHLLENKEAPPDRFVAPALDVQQQVNLFKTRVETVQKQTALLQFKLDAMLEELEAMKADRAQEPALWQTHYDYVRARLAAQITYYHEYNYMCGQMRRDLPELDPKLHAGWRFVPHQKIQDRDGAKYVKRAAEYLRLIAQDNPGTLWEEVAKEEAKRLDSGWKWEGYPK